MKNEENFDNIDFFSENFIFLDLDLLDKESVIEEIVTILDQNNLVENKERLIKDIHIREEEASTSMGLGIAIPHAQSKAVKEVTVIFIRLSKPILWNEDNVSMIFGIFVPEENANNIHLKILSSLARKLMRAEFRQQLLDAKNKLECKTLLNEICIDYD